MRDQVRAYYDRFGEREWLRLTDPEDGALEFLITCNTRTTYLVPQSRVLDIGAGPGRYSIWLAQRGCEVVLADLSPELLRIAREQVALSGTANQIVEIVESDARDLSRWDDGSFDAVLSLGPFYHLPDPLDRAQAARELTRVLRPGGYAFIALMPRYAFLRRTLAIPDERHHFSQPGFVDRVPEQGLFENDIPGRFTGGYGVRPPEVAPFFARHGLQMRALLTTESMVPDLQGSLVDCAHDDPSAYAAAIDLLLRVAGDPAIHGMASHLLYVGCKVDARTAHGLPQPLEDTHR